MTTAVESLLNRAAARAGVQPGEPARKEPSFDSPADEPGSRPMAGGPAAPPPESASETIGSCSPAARDLLQDWLRDRQSSHESTPPPSSAAPEEPAPTMVDAEQQAQLLGEFHTLGTVQLARVLAPQNTPMRAFAMAALARREFLDGCGDPDDPRQQLLCEIVQVCHPAANQFLHRALTARDAAEIQMLTGAATRLFGEARKAALASVVLAEAHRRARGRAGSRQTEKSLDQQTGK